MLVLNISVSKHKDCVHCLPRVSLCRRSWVLSSHLQFSVFPKLGMECFFDCILTISNACLLCASCMAW